MHGVRDRAGLWAARDRLLPLLALLVALELAVGAVALGRVHADSAGHRTAVASTQQPAAAPARPDDRPTLSTVRELLDLRARAVLQHDRSAFLDSVTPKQSVFRSRQAMLYDNLRSVPLSVWSYQVHSADELTLSGTRFAHYGGPVWGAKVALHYAFAGIDSVDTSRLQYLTFIESNGHWYIAADDDFASVGQPSWRGLWDYGPVLVASGEHCLVLAHPHYASQLASFAAAVDAAIPRVSAIWDTGWDQRVAVLIPDTQQEMNALVGGQLDLAHIAAVATADYTDTADHVARGQRVVINPANLASLGSVGRDVVLRHELTHVATRAVTGPATPVWLKEGFADFVGYVDAGVSTRVAARELEGGIQRGTVPSTLPADGEFAGGNPRLSQIYEEAWLACRLIADQAGTQGLVRFYRLVGEQGGDPTAAVTAALRSVLGISYDTFLVRWRAELVAELS